MMNWNQIESKWAAMTRRVRADWTTERNDESLKPLRSPATGVARSEVQTMVIAARTTATPEASRQKATYE